CEIDRENEMVLDMILEQPDAEEAEGHDNGAASERNKSDATDQAAQPVEVSGLAIHRREADRSEIQTEMRHGAKDEHPRPYGNIDAVFETAHPTRQDDLREVEQAGAQDSHGKCEQGVALRAFAFAFG